MKKKRISTFVLLIIISVLVVIAPKTNILLLSNFSIVCSYNSNNII